MALEWISNWWRRLYTPVPIERTVHLFLVRSGEYELLAMTREHRFARLNPNGGPLTETGRQQAVTAAEVIRSRCGGSPVLVIDPGDARYRPSYRETAQIIADTLGVPFTHDNGSLDPLMSFHRRRVDEFHAQALFDLRRRMVTQLPRNQRPDDFPPLRAVMVLDGSRLNRLLANFPGPVVTGGDELGPPLGSVHELVITYNRKTGEPISRTFVEPATEPTDSPTP